VARAARTEDINVAEKVTEMANTKLDAGRLASAWHYRREWGFKSVPQAGDWAVMGRALLICANADGQLAPSEREWILGYMASNGAPAAMLEELAAFDATGDVLALLPKSDAVNKSRRVLIEKKDNRTERAKKR